MNKLRVTPIQINGKSITLLPVLNRTSFHLLKNAKNSSIIIINNSTVKTATTAKCKNKKGNKIRYMKKTISFKNSNNNKIQKLKRK